VFALGEAIKKPLDGVAEEDALGDIALLPGEIVESTTNRGGDVAWHALSYPSVSR
jgi:hypothetical protein